MNEPIDLPLTAIPDDGSLTSLGPWPVHPMPQPRERRALPAWVPAGRPGLDACDAGRPGLDACTPGGYPVPPTAARTAWAVPGPNPATVSPPPFVLTPPHRSRSP